MKRKNVPNLAIIDEAIRRMKASPDGDWSCCVLLESANDAGLSYEDGGEYTQQYSRLCYLNGRPKWWNGQFNKTNKRHRIEALKAFRQACIDAGAKK